MTDWLLNGENFDPKVTVGSVSITALLLDETQKVAVFSLHGYKKKKKAVYKIQEKHPEPVDFTSNLVGALQHQVTTFARLIV